MAENLKKVMYVEDDPTVSKLAIMTLEHMGGFDVLHCPDGYSAIDQWSSFKPDVILMDVMMPGIDGCQTCEAIRKSEEGQEIPVIFVTANVQPDDMARYKDTGGQGYISKPFNPQQLCEIILQLIHHWYEKSSTERQKIWLVS